MPPATIFCGNLPVGCKSQQLLDLFEPFGKVNDHNIVKTYAFIEFENLEEAEKAVKALNRTKMEEKTLTVEISQKKEKGSGAGNKRGNDRGDRRDRDRDYRRRDGPENRVGGPPPSMNMGGMGMPGLDPMSIIGALTGQLPMQQPMQQDVGRTIDEPVVVYEKFHVDPNHPLLKGLPLPKMPHLFGR